jgi:hypothetical protein
VKVCRLIVLLFISLYVSPAFSQQVTLCPEGIATEPHEEWWPVPGFIPANYGWVFSEWDLRTEFSISQDIAPYLERLVTALRAKGITLIAISVPTRGMLHAPYLDKTNPLATNYSAQVAMLNYLATLEQYKSLGIVMVDPLPYLTTYTDALNFKTDMHWTPAGARQVALAVADTLSTLPGVRQQQKPLQVFIPMTY